jgi:enoyl-CoA hydratase
VKFQFSSNASENTHAMTESVLLAEDRGAVRVLTVHRPDKLNALNVATLDALQAAFDAAASDAAVRAIVLTGSGVKAFVAGADIAEMNALSPVEGRDFSLRGQKMMRRVEKMPKPVIAMINGFALGGGKGPIVNEYWRPWRRYL